MGWQDRDYAQGPQPTGFGGTRGTSWRADHKPWGIVTTLIVANVVVYVLQVMTIRGPGPTFSTVGALGWMQTDAVLHGQIWRLFTAQYLHASGNHILFNMIGLYFLGRAVERIWSPRKFFVIYTICGLCGNLFYMLLGVIGWLSMEVPLVGASGCILGLLGIAAVYFPRAEIYVMFLFPIKIRTAAMVFAGLYALNLWSRGANAGGDAAHLAGLVFGVWYAVSGDRWWAQRGSRAWSQVTSRSGTARSSGGSMWGKQVEQRRADAEMIDRLLSKVHTEGLHSLTAREKRMLTEATERQRREEERVGRTDRL